MEEAVRRRMSVMIPYDASYFWSPPFFVTKNAYPLIALVLVMQIPLLVKQGYLSPFYGRKLVHLGSCTMLAIVYDKVSVVVMLAIALTFLVLCLVPRQILPIASRYDLNIIFFALTVMLFVLFRWPADFLATLFVADPVAAIVGRLCQTTTGERSFSSSSSSSSSSPVFSSLSTPSKRGKTLIGSLAFACASFTVTRLFEDSRWLLISVVAVNTVAERCSEYDDAALGILAVAHCLLKAATIGVAASSLRSRFH